eukprot:SAG31_NODE_2643_length_5320_cov_13.447998_5_plen_128_part_01
MHSGLPTIILSDTGGTADAVALKLNESLKDKKELEEEEAKRKESMPKIPDDLFASSQEEHLRILYEHIETKRQGKRQDKKPRPGSYSSTRATKSTASRKTPTASETNDSLEFENPVVTTGGTGYVTNP